MKNFIRQILFGFLLIFALSDHALCHPLDMGFFQVEVGQGVKVSLDLNATQGGKLVDIGDWNEELLKSRAADLFQVTLGAGELQSDETSCSWAGIPRASIIGQSIRIENEAQCSAIPQKKVVLTLPMLKNPKLPATFHLLVKANIRGDERIVTVPEGSDRLIVEVEGGGSGFTSFLLMGMKHIGAHPSEWRSEDGGFQLPEGVDHILFVLALVLIGGGLWSIAKTVTGFTIGHSITLALGATGVLMLPSRFTESVIALSIAYVAFEAVRAKTGQKFWLAAIFGMIHGFGFASALTELNLAGKSLLYALIGFNVGVEVGQLTIVLVAVPFLMLLNRNEKAKLWVVRAFGAVIFLLASYWFIERAFGLEG